MAATYDGTRATRPNGAVALTAHRFEWDLRGFGKVVQELQEFSPPEQVRIVPHIKMVTGGHRFRLTAVGDSTRVNHELEITPKGPFRLFGPIMGIIGRKNLRDTANALKAHLERSPAA